MRYLRTVCCLLALLTACHLAQAQHLGSRQQWQPQTESDPRLQQPVQLEIIGRAAITGLPILSEKTGVSLSVAPEDLSTVGERKFTVIAQGCSLKAIMVQLEEALQECHWDVDAGGKELVYLLHRNAGVDYTQEEGPSPHQAARAAAAKANLLTRLEVARQWLAMSPEELVAAEKTDFVLSRSLRSPTCRALIEGIVSLSPDQVEQLVDTGILELGYAEAPEPAQRSARAALERRIRICDDMLLDPSPLAPGITHESLTREVDRIRGQLRRLPETKLRYRVSFPSFDPEVELLGERWRGIALPSRYATPQAADMLRETGMNLEAISRVAEEGMKQRSAAEEQWIDDLRRADSPEPGSPELHRTVTLGDRGYVEMVELEQIIARETGLSIIADCFVGDSVDTDAESRVEQPVWRLLGLLAHPAFHEDHHVFSWELVGSCLVFHNTAWAHAVTSELPESLLAEFQARLDRQGRLTLDDLADLAVAVSKLPLKRGYVNLPKDLSDAGAHHVDGYLPYLLLVSSLNPEQRAAASAEGLAVSEMTPAQRDQIRQVLARTFGKVEAAKMTPTVFRITESRESEGGRQYHIYRPTVELSVPPVDPVAARIELPECRSGQGGNRHEG